MSDNIKIKLLHSNDMHGDFLPQEKDGKSTGGVSLLSGFLKKKRAEDPNTVYAISGDMFKGSIIDSEYKGISTIELMNLLRPDVVTLGNHEIDYGVAHLLFIEKCARFPIINANLFIKTNHVRLFTPYHVVERDGIKIMFIGIITDEVLASTKSEAVVGSFIDVRAAAEEIGVICDTYKNSDINYTVVLSHIGIEADRQLAELLDPNWGVDLIVGGHSHTFMEQPEIVNGVPIIQAGTGTDIIGCATITFDRRRRRPVGFEWEVLPIDEDHCSKDPVIDQTLARYKSTTDEKYGRVITNFVRPLTHPSRIQETELGNLFADLMQMDSSFDIMFLGSGSLRLPSLGPIVTLQDLKEFFPYDDSLHLVTVTGAQLRRMVTHILREEAYAGHTEFYQYSKGVRFVWSRKRQCFDEFSFNGKPIADDDRIKIGLQKYHFENFDDFFGVPIAEVSQNRRPRVVATSCCGIYEELLATRAEHDAHVEGRLVVLND